MSNTENIESRGKIAIEEIGFGETEIELLGPSGNAESQLEVLPPAEKIAFTNADITNGPVGRGETGAHGKLPGGFFRHLNIYHRPVGAAPGRIGHFHLLKKTQIPHQ